MTSTASVRRDPTTAMAIHRFRTVSVPPAVTDAAGAGPAVLGIEIVREMGMRMMIPAELVPARQITVAFVLGAGVMD